MIYEFQESATFYKLYANSRKCENDALSEEHGMHVCVLYSWQTELGIGYGLEVHVQKLYACSLLRKQLHAGPHPTFLLLGLNTVKKLSLLMLFLLEVQYMHDACSLY